MSILCKRQLAVAGIVMACALATGCPPPQVVDAPASGLAISSTVLDLSPPGDGKVAVVVQFFQAGKFVQLADSNTVTCNGVMLSWNGLGYAERVPVVAAGGHL